MKISSFFKLSSYINKCRYLYDKYYYNRKFIIADYDIDTEININRQLYKKFGLNYDEAIIKRDNILVNKKISKNFDCRSCFSEHYTLLAAFQDYNFKRILEIGTYNGEFAYYLSCLFPEAEIVTIDLPDDDPLFINTYNRDNTEIRNKFLEKRNKLIENERIRFIQKNSFLLPSLNIGTFDFIWVDADHEFPNVAFDICNGFNLLNDGGIMGCDDIYIPTEKRNRLLEQLHRYDPYDALYPLIHLNYEHAFLLKRFDASWSQDIRLRKHIAIFKK